MDDTKVHLITDIRWHFQRTGFIRRWSVTTESPQETITGWALSRRSAMRQTEQVINMYQLMAAAVGATIHV